MFKRIRLSLLCVLLCDVSDFLMGFYMFSNFSIFDRMSEMCLAILIVQDSLLNAFKLGCETLSSLYVEWILILMCENYSLRCWTQEYDNF